MDNRIHALILLLGLIFIGGCASARHVMKDAESGIVAIPANSERNREKAIELMEQHFPDGYIIEREEETVVGQTTHQQIDAGASIEGDGKHTTGQTRSTATTVPNTEYRIFYRRR